MYTITVFTFNKYYTYQLTALEAIRKYGMNKFIKSINANAFYENMISVKS